MSFNLNYSLDEHGWSTCNFYINGKLYQINITHIFPNHPPIENCIKSLLSIMKGQKESSFYWYGEPGGEKITLNELDTKKNYLMLTAINCDHFYEKQDDENEIFFEVLVSKKMLITLFFYEFKKISILMREKEYEKNRNGEFPFKLFKEFELKVNKYLRLN